MCAPANLCVRLCIPARTSTCTKWLQAGTRQDISRAKTCAEIPCRHAYVRQDLAGFDSNYHSEEGYAKQR
eukprot:2993-Eustigmatos_ZCMA.PRE.1